MKVLVTQLCLTLCDPMSVHRIFQARVLGWLPSPSPGDLPHPGIKPGSPALASRVFITEPPGKPILKHSMCLLYHMRSKGFLGGSNGKEPTCNSGDIRDVGSIPVSGRSPGGGHCNPLQYSCLKNSMDRGAWQATYGP